MKAHDTWYPSIKDGWSCERIKYRLVNNDGGVWGTDFVPDGTIVLRSTEQNINGSWNIIDPAIRDLTPNEFKKTKLEEGDLLVTKSSGSALHIGKTSYVDSNIARMNCAYSNFMQRLRFDQSKDCPKFFFYFLNSYIGRQQLHYLSNSTTGLANLSAEILGQLVCLIPSLNIQKDISDFLDYKTAQIDNLIAEKERLLKLLEEKRIALITQAVTKGLDSNVKMRPSGIDWLGDIPVHWEVKRLKYVFDIINGSTPSSSVNEYWDGDINWFTPDDIGFLQDKYVTESKRKISTEGFQNCGVKIAPINSIILSTRAPIGHLAITLVDCCINQGCRLLIPKNLIPEYWYYLLLISKSVLQILGQGTTFSELSTSKLASFMVSVPSYSEQKQIIEFIIEKENEIKLLYSEVEKAIKKLKEYRISLITSAVTGKIDVRNFKQEKENEKVH